VLTSRVMEGEAELTREMGPGPEEAQGRQAGPGPEAMRAAMADYVAAVHTSYLDASADLTAGERGRLPLVAAGAFTVAAVGSQNLHIIGTCDQLPAPTGQEVSLAGSDRDLAWTLRFFDPVIIPGLGLVDESREPQPDQIRDLLGLSGVVYHLTVPPGGGLSAHHALHAGTGLAHSHATASRDYDTLSNLLPRQASAIAEMRAAEASGLVVAVTLLAQHISGGDDDLRELIPGDASAPDARRALLSWTRERT
jgi:hypothetical protein